MRADSSNDGLRKNESKRNIACAHPSESKTQKKAVIGSV